MIDPIHKLHDLLPSTVNRIRGRETRLNGDKIQVYNFKCKTERFKTSPIVFTIDINTICHCTDLIYTFIYFMPF